MSQIGFLAGGSNDDRETAFFSHEDATSRQIRAVRANAYLQRSAEQV